MGHLEYVPMPGGAAAVERPYRMALSYLQSLVGDDALADELPLLRDVSREERALVHAQIEQGVNSPLTSSCGRLFDAVSAIIGIRGVVDYDAQAAIELEMAAGDVAVDGYPFLIEEQNGVYVVRLGDLLRSVVDDVRRGATQGDISSRFHGTMADMTAEVCLRISEGTGIRRVALSGGVFQNRLLLRMTVAALERSGFEVLTHSLVPTNDGGISLGQAVIANFVS
jgi:hydrogenase maturation protein HypF